MIKRICIFSFIFILAFANVSAFAMEVSLPTIGGLGDLGYGLVGGAKFDFNESKYSIKNLEQLTQAQIEAEAEAQAYKFMQDYCFTRGIPMPYTIDDPSELPNDTYSFFKSYYFDNNVRKSWSAYRLATTVAEQNQALRFPISGQSYADWAQYQESWYTTYVVPDVAGSLVPVEIPIEYQTYTALLNGTANNGFIWSDMNSSNTINGNYSQWILPDDASHYSFRSLQNNTNVDSSNYFVESNDYCKAAFVSNPVAVYITGSDNTYTLYCDSFESPGNAFVNWNGLQNAKYYYFYKYTNPTHYDVTGINNVSYDPVPLSYTGTLQNCLIYLTNNVRNITLFVNNDLWLLSSIPADDPIIPDFPDIIDPDSDDPAYDIVFPNTTGYEGTFDITSLFDAIKEAIIGASDSDDTTSGVLTKEAVTDTYRDTTGELVAEAEVPIQLVLDDSFPIQDTLNYPNIPIYGEPIHNAFQGTTILAQLIDATQKSLPESLILCLWGIIFILFIIGLVKILHK